VVRVFHAIGTFRAIFFPNQKRKTISILEPSIREKGHLINTNHLIGNQSARKILEINNLDESPVHARVVGYHGVSILIYYYGTVHLHCIIAYKFLIDKYIVSFYIKFAQKLLYNA
jgi:hypothetical protein